MFGNSPPTISAFGFSGPDWLGYDIMRQDAKKDWRAETEFAERMANTQWQRGVDDMQAAGINPMLAVHQGGAAAPNAPQHRGTLPPSAGTTASLQTSAQRDVLHAEAELKRAETEEVRARTPTYAVTIDQMRQTITESVARIEDLRASVQERAASASRQYQQTENLRAELPRIRADTNRLIQQARNFVADTTLKTADEKRIQQQLKANLPEIERLQKDLELEIGRLMRPGKELDAEVRQSFTGILGAYLKALLPAIGLFGGLKLGGSKGPTTSGTIHKGVKGGPDIHRR